MKNSKTSTDQLTKKLRVNLLLQQLLYYYTVVILIVMGVPYVLGGIISVQLVTVL